MGTQDFDQTRSRGGGTTEAAQQRLLDCVGQTVVDSNGERIGELAEVYLDEETSQPEWLAVTTGWFGTKTSFIPLQGASFAAGELMVRWSKDVVKDAPKAEPDGHLSEAEEAELYQHYGVSFSDSRSSSQLPNGQQSPRETNGTTERMTATGTTDSDRTRRGRTDDAMTRSEQELDVQKTSREAGKARLRKWVETEHVSFTVPVRREKARLVTEPITDATRDRALDGPEISDGEHEIVLREEEVEVGKRTVPKERVRLETETVTEQRQLEADLAKERLEVEGDVERRSRR